MAGTISAQLKAIKALAQVDSEPPLKRPFTRPSLLFDPKEAADLDVDTVLSLSLQGLDVLISLDERFRNFKNDLFSHKSKEMDRELMGIEDNNRINAIISSYLRLVSVYFQHPSAIKTLEYLIRRYKIHAYNFEDLILCSLPYHETHVFVRIVQLIDTGNSKWQFLNGVKSSGAPPPRRIIVQQFLRDKGVLEALCNYASPSKKLLPSRPMISFCTAVVIEALGSATSIENDIVTRILPFVNSGLQLEAKGGSDHKAGALMIVGLLASKVALSPKLVKTLIRSVAEIARDDATESVDLQWVRMSLMTMINLIQLQSVDSIPRKALELLIEIRDFSGIISELFKEFKIEKFFSMLLDSLVDFSFSDESSQHTLISILEVSPVKDFVYRVVAKILSYCLKTAQKNTNVSPSPSGHWVKQILSVLNKKYPSELHGAINKFLKDNNSHSKKENSVYEILGTILDGNFDASHPTISHSKLWFALHHPKADVRRGVLSGLNTNSMIKTKATDPQGFSSIQDAILRQLYDDNLDVVEAAVSLDGLTDIIDSSNLYEALNYVLKRCIGILYSRSSENTKLACDVALGCLKKTELVSSDNKDWLNCLGSMIWPLLLILPKTQSLNLKALEIAKKVDWPLYENLSSVPSAESLLLPEIMSSLNLGTVTCLAERILMLPETYVASLAENCKDFDISKTLLLLVLMQSLAVEKNKSSRFFAFLEAVYPVLKAEWEVSENLDIASVKELNSETLKKVGCREILDLLSGFNFKALNTQILVHTFWRLLESLEVSAPAEVLHADNKKWFSKLEDLFVFFSVSKFNHVFKEHRLYLVAMCKSSPLHFWRRFYTEPDVPVAVQVESLQCFFDRCAQTEPRMHVQLLAEFPSILVPLASDNKDVRSAAMNCVEGLRSLWARIDGSSKKNGNQAIWSQFIDKLLDSVIQQKRLILSDRDFLPSFLVCLLSSSSSSYMAPKHIDQRFDQSTREKILAFILGSALTISDYAKLKILSLLKGVGNAVICVKELESFLSQLLKRRIGQNLELGASDQKLSNVEIDILCLLLEICSMPPPFDGCVFEDHLLNALRVDGMAMDDPAIIRPCLIVLKKLNEQVYKRLKNEMQELLFREIVILFRSANGDIQNAAREAILHLSITCSTIVKMLDQTFHIASPAITSEKRKKKRKLAEHKTSNQPYDGENALSSLSSLLDILLLKKDIANRDLLVGPLFKLVSKTFSDEWIQGILDDKLVQVISADPETIVTTISDIQQRLLIVLKDISTSLIGCSSLKKEVVNEMNIKALVACASSTKDGVTRNHVFTLISSIAKIAPERVLEHIEEIFSVIGESAISQVDRHSQHVFEELVSTIVPYWLQRAKSMDTLLQIFMNVLPDVTEHRRLSMVVYILRTLGESDSLASLLALLFRSLVSRKCSKNFADDDDAANSFITSSKREWEYVFAVQICEQYSCLIWLPSLVMLLHKLGIDTPRQELFMELMFVIQFIEHKLQDPEFSLKLDSNEESENIQGLLEDLMEQVGPLLHLVDTRGKQITVPVVIKNELKERIRFVCRSITSLMIPSTCFKGIIRLLHHADKNVGKKALGILCEMLRGQDTVKSRRKDRSINSQWQHMSDADLDSFQKLCLEIVKTIDNPIEFSDESLKLAAVSALEVLATRFPFDHSIFSRCLASVSKYITSADLAISSCSLRTTGTLVNVLGPRALSDLPCIMENVIKITREVALCLDLKAIKIMDDKTAALSTSKATVFLSVLSVLEAVVDKLGGFLNPYLGDILSVLVVNTDYASSADQKVKLKADTLRKLITEKIPVRLAVPPLLKLYPNAVVSGDLSLTVYFGMLANLISIIDRPSVGAYHAKIFDVCLLALDLRRQQPVSVRNIDVVEENVVATVISLTMKLTETMFKPLFIRSIEWAETDDGEHSGRTNLHRAVSFYGLVNKLAENHRSLFVPYFKYLLENCVRYLTLAGDSKVVGLTKKSKKAKLSGGEITTGEENNLSVGNWQLRALILSSLHKCFLYDTGSLKFLDSSNFQVLLKPVVLQLTTEPPAGLEDHPNLPSVKEVDDLVVSCVGQMAVAAGSDLLWKPLNTEVLMQTRSENVRTRILGLRIIKHMVEHLREEYLVFLTETITFLGELLEDVEPSVKSLAQDILKEMESLSGENLREYLS